MSRLVFVLFPALALAACSGSEGTSVPPQTVLVRNVNGAPLTPALSPDGTRLAWSQPVGGQSRIHLGSADGSNPEMLTQGTWDSNPHWSPNGEWIAFFGESPGFDVWIVAAAGGEPRQLTSGPAVDTPVGWLPDNSGVVFFRRGAGEDRTLVAPVDGGPPRPLVPHRGGNQYAMPSPDGSRVSIEIRRGSESTIWVADANGDNARQLTTEGLDVASPTSKTWSPDGRYLAYTSRRTGTADIWTADVETGELRQITADIRNDFEHTWSPDSRWIAFVSDRGGQWDVWVVSADGGEAMRVTDDLAGEQELRWTPDGQSLYFTRIEMDGQLGVAVPGAEPRVLVNWPGYQVAQTKAVLSPDERTVLFEGTRSGNPDIWSVPLAGGEAVPFASGPLNERNPGYAPDGSAVAFDSDRTGSWDIFVVAASGGEPRRLTDWSSNEERPAWSPDGSQIAFISDQEATQEDVWVVPAEGGSPRRITTLDRDILGKLHWSPDGRSLYVLRTGEDGATLHRVPVSGGRSQALQIPSTTSAWGGALSPDGAWFAYSSIERGWAFLEITPTSGGAPRRISRGTDHVWNTAGIWSRDGSKIAISDWQFDDDATANVIEFSVGDATTRELTSRPRSFEEPEAYTSDGRLVYSAAGFDSRIVKVSMAALLTPP